MTPRRTEGSGKAPSSDAKGADDDLIVPKDAASTSFVQALVARGQAARVEPGGSLPPGVTHEIVGQTEAGLPILRRLRFA